MSLSRHELEAFLNDGAFAEVDALLASVAAEELDELLTESAIEAGKRRIDETFKRAVENFFAGKVRT